MRACPSKYVCACLSVCASVQVRDVLAYSRVRARSHTPARITWVYARAHIPRAQATVAAQIPTNPSTRARAHTNTRAHTQTRARASARTPPHTHTHARAHTRAHTHARTHTQGLEGDFRGLDSDGDGSISLEELLRGANWSGEGRARVIYKLVYNWI